MKKYRVNESELFNLQSMYDKAMCRYYDAQEAGTTAEEFNAAVEFVEELENLLDKAPYIGSLVDWQTLKRIREIREERNFMRYNKALEAGATEMEAGNAFM